MAQMKGKTSDSSSPILGAAFWKRGTKIEGTVIRNFPTVNGTCSEILLKTPVKVNGNTEKKVSIGALAGFRMALNSAGLEELQEKDSVIIECTGSTPTGKGNPRVDFNVAVNRPD